MTYDPHLLDMTPDGQFRAPPRVPMLPRIIAGAVVLAVVAGGLAAAAFALWLAMILLPVAILAAGVAILAFRLRVWRARRQAGAPGGAVYRRW